MHPKEKSANVRLKKGREKSLFRKHPWIFSGAVDAIEGVSDNGQPAKVFSSDFRFLGMASVSLNSQIRARMWSFGEEIAIPEIIKPRIEQAIRRRKQVGLFDQSDAVRLVFSEADLLPGLIVDRYDSIFVCQFLSAGAEFFKKEIIVSLMDFVNPDAIYERSDTDARVKEGLDKKSGLLAGAFSGKKVKIKENDINYLVDITEGHKTGFYLDQRDNRFLVSKNSRNAEVLNAFSYTGGFGMSALVGGALSVTNIDTSAQALELSQENAVINGFDAKKIVQINGDVFKELRNFRDAGKTFDVVVLDPPKFAESVSQLEKASRGYKDINLLAMKLLKPGGLLFTFSCSGHIVPELFRKIVSDAAVDADRDVQLLQNLQQAADHPVLLTFPESFYLKGLMCRVW